LLVFLLRRMGEVIVEAESFVYVVPFFFVGEIGLAQDERMLWRNYMPVELLTDAWVVCVFV